uniref:PB1-like domain-containing protein n=1 Tax=Nicotiana tabacum TaxID=4097 RepID=A0A1S4D5I8_TOBAC|nr:PREDICTED: uncharacterized protein LOC107826208 [Nicotiana tabacum]
MIIRCHGSEIPNYDPAYEAIFFSVKVTHGGTMKHQPSRYYLGGRVDFIDYVNYTELNLSQFKSMAELCGYERDSVTFWHKCGRYGNRMRLVSTDVEATVISKNIPDHKMVELYFEHLDSYIAKTTHTNEVGGVEQEKEVNSEHSLTDDEFEDSKNNFSDDNENVNHRHEVSEEVKKK